MIVGIGIDVCDIARMEEQLKNQRFLPRFFSPAEQAYIASRGRMAAASAAGIFAAKEALVKALGTGFTDTRLFEISVEHDKCGAPFYALSGNMAQHAAQRNITSFHLSITHDAGVAAAVAIAERV